MNAVSFVSTTANDKTLNKLEGADGNEKISVEIAKDAGSETTITVTLTNN